MASGPSTSISLQPFVFLETEVSNNEAFFVAMSSLLSSTGSSSPPRKSSCLSLLQDETYLVGLVMNSADPDVSTQQFQSQFSSMGSFNLELHRQLGGSENDTESNKANSVFEYKSTPTRVTSSSFLEDLKDDNSLLRNHKAVYFHHDKGTFIVSWVHYKVDDSLLRTSLYITMNVCTYMASSKISKLSQQDSQPIDHEQIVLNLIESSRYRVIDNCAKHETSIAVQFACPLQLNTLSHLATDSSYLSIQVSNITPNRLLYIHVIDLNLKETRKHESVAFVDAYDMFILTCMNPPDPESSVVINAKECYNFVFRITAKMTRNSKDAIQDNIENMELFEGMNISTLHVTYSTGSAGALQRGINRSRIKEIVVSKVVTWQGVVSDQRFSILGKSKDLGNAKKYEPICTEYSIKNLSSIDRKIKLISLNHDNETTPDLLFFENESEQVMISAGEVVTLSVFVLPLREGVVNKNTVLLEEEELIDVDTNTGEKEKKRTIFQISDHFVPIEIGVKSR